jgi:hypothetical protein
VYGTTTLCAAQPHCTNGVKDADETDVDCGGAGCGICGAYRNCSVDSDCAIRCNQAGTCESHCFDGRRDFGETDFDCGGSLCGPCAAGRYCRVNSDCASGQCSPGGACHFVLATHCTNGVQDADETDVDCGGPGCNVCPFGRHCSRNADCGSNACSGGVCASHCFDGIIDFGESDVDCGASCVRCSTGRNCRTGGDCVSGMCGANWTCQ